MKALLTVIAALGLAACATDTIIAAPVPAAYETDAMAGDGDRADDPAIWVHPTDPARSLILATNKDEGVYVYGLDGKERQKLPVGLSNNVDVRGNLAVASNDGVNALSFFRIDPATQNVTHAGNTKLVRIEPYGVCAGMIDGKYRAAVSFKDGNLDIWTVNDSGAGPVTLGEVRTAKLATQIEGCVFDDEHSRIFVAEENHGLWAIDLASNSAPVSVDTIAAKHGLVADVEGVSIYAGPDGSGYLVASAQEKDRYVVYDRMPPYAVAGVITITQSRDGLVDAVTHTDGLDISSAPLPNFPKGILVVQDDGNPTKETSQNFKVVDWRNVEAALAAAKAAAAKP